MLNVTQPAVSAALRQCEAQLKMKLFSRTGGRLRPTPEAEAIFPEVAEIFTRVDTVGRLSKDLIGGRLGTLSIAGAFPITNSIVAEVVASFIIQRPDLRVMLHTLTTPQVLDKVRNREVELGVVYEDAIGAEFETEVLTKIRLACVLLSSHPLAKKQTISVKDLQPYPIITYLPQTILRSHVNRALQNGGVDLRINVQVGLSITAIMLARYGAGIALVDPLLANAMATPRLVSRPLRPSVELNVILVRNRLSPHSAVSVEFVKSLKKLISQPKNIKKSYA